MSKNEFIYYRIGEIVFKIISDLPYPFPDGNASDFRIDAEKEDYTYIFQKVDSIPEITGNLTFVEDVIVGHDLLNDRGIHFRGFTWKNDFYDTVVKLEETQGMIFYLSANILAERYQNGFNFFNYFETEHIFLQHDALILHGSHTVINGKALIFSGASGIGKSTQAKLWEKYAGGKIINGDRTLLRKKNGTWHAYGCPMCGTSGIHLQSLAPVTSIVMLEQGVENNVQKLSPSAAFSLIYPQITVQRWNRKEVMHVIELLDDLIQQIPIIKYSCTKDINAVSMLKEKINL